MDRHHLIAAIDAQEQLRGTVPDDVVDTTVAVLRRRLRDLDASRQRRRQVTVLFADVRGFTSMSEALDAERVTAVMNGVWTRLDRVVDEFGGTVDKHIGDGLMALWGTDESREDDPERAVRAALAMLSALAHLADETERGLEMRVGVHTGRAVVGAVGSAGEVTAMGDTVNVANRLETAARVGGVLVSHDTYRHVRGVFDVRRLEPLVVRGRSEAVQVYEVTRAKPHAFRMPTRGVEGVETRMIGRDDELVALRAAFDEVAGGGGSRLVTVIGEAGIGKSRLLYEFDNWLELEQRTAYYFKGRATAHRQSVPLGLMRDVIAARCMIAEGDAADAVREKLVVGLGGALEPSEAALVGRWLGFDHDSGVPEGKPWVERMAVVGRTLLQRYVRALAADAPVVLLVEDLHWADDDSIDVIDSVRRSLRGDALLVVAATRPEFFERRHGWGNAEGDRSVALAPLTADGARSLVREVLREADPVPDALIRLVADRAEGNPFYVEELVKMLVDDGVIDTSADRWIVQTERFDGAQVPTTLTGVLQSRLDGLAAEDRRSLQRAAVIGRVFWADAVASLGRDEPVALDAAVGRELVHERRPSVFPGTSEFIFRHALLHDVAYESVLLSERPALHSSAADWIEAMARDRLDEYLVEIAEHRRRAGQLDQAAACFERAASSALQSGSVESARRLALTASDLSTTAASPTTIRALVTAARSARLSGRLAIGLDEANRARDLARELDDDHLLFTALFEEALIAEAMGDHDDCRRMLTDALPLAERSSDADMSSALAGLAWSDLHAGNVDAAEMHAARSLELAERTGVSEQLSRALNVVSAVACSSGDFRAAIGTCERSVALSEACGDVVGQEVALCDLGVAWHLLGDAGGAPDAYGEAEAAYRRALNIARDHGLTSGAAIALANLAQLAVRMHDPTSALDLARDALALHVESGAVYDTHFAVLAHAEALAACGDVDRALDHVLAVRAHPSIGMLRDEVATILDRLVTDHGLDLEAESRCRPILELEVVVGRIVGIHER